MQDPHRLYGAAIFLACLLAACGGGAEAPAVGSTEETPRRGGIAILGTITDVDGWNEFQTAQAFSTYVLRRIYLPLARESEAGFDPVLATDWSFSEDRRTLTFRLRDATWSDGVPITSADVRYTWQAQTSPDVAWANAEIKEAIVDVEAVDERTVAFRFERPYPYQLSDAIEGGILPKHVFETVPFDAWATHDWSDRRVGSGPFLPKRHDIGSEIELERNPRYHEDGRPYLDGVLIRVIPDAANLMAQLESGDLDFFHDVPPRDARRLADEGRGRVTPVPYAIPRYDYLGWNGARKPFGDARVRRALTQAIDREELVETMLYGYGVVGCRPVPVGVWGTNPEIDPWPYDPESSRAALAAAGYGPGTPLSFEVLVNSGNRLRNDVLVKIQEQLSRVGVDVEIRTLEQSALIDRVRKGEFDAYLGGWNVRGRLPLANLFASDSLPATGGYNFVGYASPAVDRALAELESAVDRESLEAPLHAVQREIHLDQPYTFLYERAGVAAHDPRLRGVEIRSAADPLGGLDRFWIAAP